MSIGGFEKLTALVAVFKTGCVVALGEALRQAGWDGSGDKRLLERQGAGRNTSNIAVSKVSPSLCGL